MMTVFSMARAYEGRREIPTKDLVSAVKHSLNLEADLYQDGELVVSWLGLSMKENIDRLCEKGISTFVVNNRYGFKYIDKSMNKTLYYVVFYLSKRQDGTNQLDVQIHDYHSSTNEKLFRSFSEIFSYIKAEYKTIKEEFLYMWLFDDYGATKVHLDQEPLHLSEQKVVINQVIY